MKNTGCIGVHSTVGLPGPNASASAARMTWLPCAPSCPRSSPRAMERLMPFSKFAFFVAALALAAPLGAETRVAPAVQPGGDIPSHFQPVQPPPIPPGGDIPKAFNAPRGGFQYVRREVRIPMRDGVKLYGVLIIPRGGGKFPIMLDRTPYSADKATSRGNFGPLPENILSPLSAELVRAGYIVAVEDVRGKYKSEG